ncbi:MAG: DUF4405 domain-containing protein [Chlorobiaceae bacterium]|nr:DUF4405 domain-containing protein [Chlorobiaceae bacterium]
MRHIMKPSFNRRKATSFALLFSFLILFASGAILWIFPRIVSFGSVPEAGGLTRPVWLKQHIVFGIIFTLLSLYHLFSLNRDAFFSYLKTRSNEGMQRRPELLATLLVTAVIATLTALQHIPSISASMKTGNDISGLSGRVHNNGENREEPRVEFREHSHQHHSDEHYDREHASPQPDDRRYAAIENGDPHLNDVSMDASRMMNNGAPDDELHRRTTASCASCH